MGLTRARQHPYQEREPDWGDKYGGLVMIAIVLTFIGLFVYACYDDYKHPCIKTRSYACKTTTCTYFDPASMTCWATEEEEDTCYTCLERK